MTKKTLLIIVGVDVVVLSLGAWLVLPFCTCSEPDCLRFKQSDSHYCSSHSCLLEDCNSHKP